MDAAADADGMFDVHATNLHTACSCVNTMFIHNTFMNTPLDRIEKWLADNEIKWADLARMLGYTEQRTTNWKKRGIPKGEYPNLQKATGLSLDYIVNGISTVYPSDPHSGEDCKDQLKAA